MEPVEFAGVHDGILSAVHFFGAGEEQLSFFDFVHLAACPPVDVACDEIAYFPCVGVVVGVQMVGSGFVETRPANHFKLGQQGLVIAE